MKQTDRSGWHLMLDALVASREGISSTDTIRETLLGLIRLLEMELLDGPRIAEVQLDPALIECASDEGGITGYCLITTSHISIHTWPLRDRFCLDIFSCKQFDKNAALEEVRRAFDVRDESVTWIERQWPPAVSSQRTSADPCQPAPEVDGACPGLSFVPTNPLRG